jgi:hypothetical protein
MKASFLVSFRPHSASHRLLSPGDPFPFRNLATLRRLRGSGGKRAGRLGSLRPCRSKREATRLEAERRAESPRPRPCDECGLTFVSPRRDRRFCSAREDRDRGLRAAHAPALVHLPARGARRLGRDRRRAGRPFPCHDDAGGLYADARRSRGEARRPAGGASDRKRALWPRKDALTSQS